ncbi:MAG: Azurin, partial [Dehalococcoidia bacterium]|nr:Azurin [Dehalococcoidia bacterium]
AVEEVANAGLVAGASNNYVPSNDPRVIAHTSLVDGGNSGSVTFQAPAPGKYSYMCSFPGHSSLMNGEFIVE